MANRFKLLSVALAFLLPSASPAMQQSASPAKFNIPWANSSVAPYVRNIPQSSQIGITNCAASLTDGFPPLTFVPSSAGGCPPFGADFNGILRQITQWSQWSQAGGPVFFNSGFSASVNGYPMGAILQSAVLTGRLWYSTADNNTTDPDSTSAANWIVMPGTTAPGTPIPTLSTTAPPNTVSANGHTIGNASSNASGRANADTYWLFVFIWNNCPSSQCALLNSSGFLISRGANAGADFAANNQIAVFNMNGLGVMGADSQGGATSTFLTGVPVTLGSRTVPGSILGENLHSLTSSENGAHTHSITDVAHTHSLTGGGILGGASSLVGVGTGAPIGLQNGGPITLNSSFTGITGTNSSGSGTGHNTVERSMIVFWNLAL